MPWLSLLYRISLTLWPSVSFQRHSDGFRWFSEALVIGDLPFSYYDTNTGYRLDKEVAWFEEALTALELRCGWILLTHVPCQVQRLDRCALAMFSWNYSYVGYNLKEASLQVDQVADLEFVGHCDILKMVCTGWVCVALIHACVVLYV